MENQRKRSFIPKCIILSCAASLLLVSPICAESISNNSCVECHSSQQFITTNKKLYSYYQRWEKSVHAEEGVTCTDCHAGDSTKAEKVAAHGQGIKGTASALSEVYYSNIPDTCGKCHQAIVNNYKESKHYEFLTKDDLLKMRGANCVTCHNVGMRSSEGNTLIDNAVAACGICHNSKTRNFPDIPERIATVLDRFASAKMLYSNLMIQHQNEIPQAMRQHLANGLLELSQDLHAL